MHVFTYICLCVLTQQWLCVLSLSHSLPHNRSPTNIENNIYLCIYAHILLAHQLSLCSLFISTLILVRTHRLLFAHFLYQQSLLLWPPDKVCRNRWWAPFTKKGVSVHIKRKGFVCMYVDVYVCMHVCMYVLVAISWIIHSHISKKELKDARFDKAHHQWIFHSRFLLSSFPFFRFSCTFVFMYIASM